MDMSISKDLVHKYLPAILENLPYEWRGTTFANSNLLGRKGFSDSFCELLNHKEKTGESSISSDELSNVGNAEDYLRVSSNISSLLELALGAEVGIPISQVFTFGSRNMPLIVILLTTKLAVNIFIENGMTVPFSAEEEDHLKLLGCNFTTSTGPAVSTDGSIAVSFQELGNIDNAAIDAVVVPSASTLYIYNTDKINPEDILVIRKRMATPLTTPVCERMLQNIVGLDLTADNDEATVSGMDDFYAHLQTMSGTDVNPACNPVVFTAGLPAICSMWLALLGEGGTDIVMASTAYGGSSQLTDLLAEKTLPGTFTKTTFDITGTNDFSEAVKKELNSLATRATNPTTCIFVEIPTNPDMKVPDMATFASHALEYQVGTGKKVVVLIDATFAPASQVLRQLSEAAPELSSMVFISMSKSVSRGLTTAGTIIANSNQSHSTGLLERVRIASKMMDTQAKKDQLFRLAGNHTGVEGRCKKAYELARAVGDELVKTVKEECEGYEMDLAFVTPQNAALGFTSSTFSFNLPCLKDGSAEDNEALAQRFVDKITVHDSFKPCVSFGQDNDLIYCTVPATSTQGAIKAEDKAKQAVGGVQLTRLSFPVEIKDVESVLSTVRTAIKELYQ